MDTRALVVCVDVDDTLVRTHGTKRIPVPAVIEHVRTLSEQGAMLYCWSSGGADYARESAEECGIARCFAGFLPKPNVVIDDVLIRSWRGLVEVHPRECANKRLADYVNDR